MQDPLCFSILVSILNRYIQIYARATSLFKILTHDYIEEVIDFRRTSEIWKVLQRCLKAKTFNMSKTLSNS